jgi:hypothetical protein
VRNTGNAALTISSVGSSNPLFTIASPSGSFTVAAGGQQTVGVRFAPAAPGAQSATLSIASNDPSRPTATVSVSGTGSGTTTAVPAIDVSPASLDFGTVTVGQSKDLSLTVRNTGNAPLTINSVASSNPRFAVASPAVPFNVAAGSQQALTIRFSPTTAGSQTGTLTIASNDPARASLTVGLSGSGVAPAGPQTVVLKVDDGTFESSVSCTGAGVVCYFVNRLTPPRYPATLKDVQIFFLDAEDALRPGDGFTLLAGWHSTGGSDLGGVSLRRMEVRVQSVGQFNVYTAPDLTILYGDFVVGLALSSPKGIVQMAQDKTPPSQKRSCLSPNAANWTLIDSFPGQEGNFGIRATVTVP